MPIDQDAVKESDKGLMETVFGQASCQGTHGLMFVVHVLTVDSIFGRKILNK